MVNIPKPVKCEVLVCHRRRGTMHHSGEIWHEIPRHRFTVKVKVVRYTVKVVVSRKRCRSCDYSLY